jgi:hypothetical protein
MGLMTRFAGPVLAIWLLGFFSYAQDDPKKKAPLRYGFDVDETTFPQKTPAEAMTSIARAIERKKVDYLLAHMADPLYVDYWVDQYKRDFTQGKDEGKRLLAFERLVRETSSYFQNDPLIVKDLRIFAKDAKWEEKDDLAIGTVETVPARKVYLRKFGERWFLENKQQ